MLFYFGIAMHITINEKKIYSWAPLLLEIVANASQPKEIQGVPGIRANILIGT